MLQVAVAATVFLTPSSTAFPASESDELFDDSFQGNEEADKHVNTLLSIPHVLANKWGIALVEGVYIKRVLDEEENDIGVSFDQLSGYQNEFGKRTTKHKISSFFGSPTARRISGDDRDSNTNFRLPPRSRTTTTTTQEPVKPIDPSVAFINPTA